MKKKPRIIHPDQQIPPSPSQEGGRGAYTLDDLVKMAKQSPLNIGGQQPQEVPGLKIPIEDDGLILYALCLYADENLHELMPRSPVRGTPTGMADHVKKMINLFEKVFEVNPNVQSPLIHRKFRIPHLSEASEPSTPVPSKVEAEKGNRKKEAEKNETEEPVEFQEK